MNRRFMFIFIFVIIVFNLSSEELKLIQKYNINAYNNDYQGVTKLIPYYRDGVFIKKTLDNSIVIESEFPIINFDKKNNLIVYTCGYGDISIPILYNLENGKSETLKAITYNNGISIYYSIIRYVHFISSKEIVFSALNMLSNKIDVCKYNIETFQITRLASKEGIEVHDFFNNKLILSVINFENYDKEYSIFNIDNCEFIKLNIDTAYNVIFYDENTFFVNERSGNESDLFLYTLSTQSKELLHIDGFQGIIGCFQNKLILSIEDKKIEQAAVYELF